MISYCEKQIKIEDEGYENDSGYYKTREKCGNS